MSEVDETLMGAAGFSLYHGEKNTLGLHAIEITQTQITDCGALRIRRFRGPTLLARPNGRDQSENLRDRRKIQRTPRAAVSKRWCSRPETRTLNYYSEYLVYYSDYH